MVTRWIRRLELEKVKRYIFIETFSWIALLFCCNITYDVTILYRLFSWYICHFQAWMQHRLSWRESIKSTKDLIWSVIGNAHKARHRCNVKQTFQVNTYRKTLTLKSHGISEKFTSFWSLGEMSKSFLQVFENKKHLSWYKHWYTKFKKWVLVDQITNSTPGLQAWFQWARNRFRWNTFTTRD